MTFHIEAQDIITAAALIAALIALARYVFGVRDWVKKQNEQDEKLLELREHHDKDVRMIQEELQLLTFGLLSCLKGLKQTGLDGPVTEGIEKIEKHLNERAHNERR